MPIPYRPSQRGLFERDGNKLLGQHYRDLVKAGKNPERLAQEEGYKLQEIPGGVRVVQDSGATEEGDDHGDH